MNIAQRIAAGLFACVLGVASLGTLDTHDYWLGLATLVTGMLFALWAIRPSRP
jgi:hypothetical protein